MALMGVGGAAHIFRHWDLAFCQRQGSQDDSDGGEYGNHSIWMIVTLSEIMNIRNHLN